MKNLARALSAKAAFIAAKNKLKNTGADVSGIKTINDLMDALAAGEFIKPDMLVGLSGQVAGLLGSSPELQAQTEAALDQMQTMLKNPESAQALGDLMGALLNTAKSGGLMDALFGAASDKVKEEDLHA